MHMDDGVQDYGNTVLFGTGYTVTEDVIPSGYAFDHVDCSASVGVTADVSQAPFVTFAIDSDTDVLDCTYFNDLQQGALRILKNSTKGGPVSQPGAVFSYDSTTVTDNGTGDEDRMSVRCACPDWCRAATPSTRSHHLRDTPTHPADPRR